MKVLVIGATGHVGTFLVPRLVAAGHDGGGGQPRPRRALPAERRLAGRGTPERRPRGDGGIGRLRPGDAGDRRGHRRRHDLLHAGERPAAGRGPVGPRRAFPAHRHDLDARPFHRRSHARGGAEAPVRRLRGAARRRSRSTCSTRPRRSGFPATIIHPGHIVGPGWAPLNPAGNFNPQVFATLARGERLTARQLRAGDGPPRPRRRPRHPVHGGDRQPGRCGRRGVPRRLRRGADPARLRRGDGALVRPRARPRLPAVSRNGRRPRRRRTRPPPGSTSPAAPTARSPRRGAGSTGRRATARSRRWSRRSPRCWRTAPSHRRAINRILGASCQGPAALPTSQELARCTRSRASRRRSCAAKGGT